MKLNFDIIIVGAGLSGAALASALKDKPIKIAVVDAKPYKLQTTPAEQDARSIALAHVSHKIFSGLNLWHQLQPYASPIKAIHISEHKGFGFSHINAKDYQVNALGYVVEFSHLHNAFYKNLKNSMLEFFTPYKVKVLQSQAGMTQLTITNGNKNLDLTAPLIIAADGGRSTIRNLAKIDVKQYDYQQTAIVANIGLEREHQNIAYERFTTTGPLAMLPLNKQCYALVWTVKPDEVAALLNLSDDEFLKQLQTKFGYRLGRLSWIGKRQHFPLQLAYAKQQYQDNIVLVGNASHNLHPVAGQGFNLGLRDVAVLAQVIADAIKNNVALTSPSLLQDYAKQRKWDQTSIIHFTNNLVKLFSNNTQVLSVMRNLGLLGLDMIPTVKQFITKRTMGYYPNLPNLALGLPI